MCIYKQSPIRDMMDMFEANQHNGQDTANFNDDRTLVIRIKSPAGLDDDIHTWPLKSSMGPQHIVSQIRSIREDFQGLKPLIDSSLFTSKQKDWTYEELKKLCNTYNQAIEVLLWQEKQAGITSRLNQKPSNELIKHILEEITSAVITTPEDLRRYKPFTPEVYGETKYDLVFQMIDQIGMTQNDVFIDLGSGVGNVVLQMAASLTCCKCIGVEKQDTPAGFAKKMDNQFRNRMLWYGKKFSDFELIHGDFLSKEIRDLINKSTIIFVNNFAFGASLDLELNKIFKEMENGTKIVSSKSFCPLNFKMNPRNLKYTGAIMHVAELKPEYSSVSWTDKPVSYYFHVIDNTKLNNYYEKKSTEGFNTAEKIMKHSIQRTIKSRMSDEEEKKKSLLLKIFGLEKELEELLPKKSEFESKTVEIETNKFEEQLNKILEQIKLKKFIDSPEAVTLDLLKLLTDGREAVHYSKTMEARRQTLNTEIEVLEKQREECIQQRTREALLKIKGLNNGLNNMNNSLLPISSFPNDEDWINELEMFFSVRKIVETQSLTNESEREKIQKSIMVAKMLLRRIKYQQDEKLQIQSPTKARYLRDVSGKLRELSPDIVEGHKYYSKMNDGSKKKKKNMKNKLKKEMSRTPPGRRSPMSQTATRKQHAAALHRIILHKTSGKQKYCDLIGKRELVVSIKKLKWTNQVAV